MEIGFKDLDKIVNLEGNNLIVISGVASMGKTAFALNIVNNVLQQDKCVLVFSMEMSKEQLNDRLIEQECLIDINKIRNAKLNDEEIERYKKIEKQLEKSKLYINDTPRNYNTTNRRTMYKNER